MFRDDIQNAFDACFHSLGVNPDDVVSTTGWYSIAQWVMQVIGGQDVKQVSIEDCFKMEWFRKALSAFCLNRYPIRQKADALFRLCEVIRLCRLVGSNAKIFFQYYLPSVVGNTSYFAWGGVKSDGALTSSVIYLVMLCAGNRLGSAEVLELVVKEEFGKVEKQLVQFGITFNEFNLCWNAVHYIDASNPFQSKPKIKKALKAYEKMNLPGTVLLEQYTHARNYHTSDWKYGLNPWEYVQHKLGIEHPERGMSADEKLFNEAVYKILKESPSDVIQTVFYGGRDDSRIECAVARTEVKLRLMGAHNVLVVNPSPMFLRLFCENMDALTRNSNIDHKIPATFAVTDRIVTELYAREHSYFKFVEMSELQSLDQMFDYVVVLARDYKSLPLWDALDRCSERANFTLLLPQTVLTQQEEHFAEELRKRNLAVNWIMDVPQKCCQSQPRKKMLVSGTKQKEYFNPKMHLFFTDSDESGSHIIPQKANITVPTAMLSRNLTLAQMRSLVSQGDKLPQPRLFETYDFSREIKICYNWIRDAEGNLVKARAYYRKFLRPDEESHRQKGKRPNDKRTERGLRGKTEEEIIPKLEEVPLYVEFFDDIVEDILEVYAGRYEELSLKGLWFCCRRELMGHDSYNEDVVKEFFCGKNQSLSNLIVGDCLPEDIESALENVYGVENISQRKWMQIVLILKVAAENGMIQNKSLPRAVKRVMTDFPKKKSLLNSNLRKNSFTDEEEMRVVQFLNEMISVPGKTKGTAPRYVVESKWLFGAFSLFTGLPIRDLAPLCWGDLHEIDGIDEMYCEITKHLNEAGKPISNSSYRDGEHFRKIGIVKVLALMSMQRKQYLKDLNGFTDEDLAEMPVFLEKERRGRGKRKLEMISRKTAQRVNKALLSAAQIAADKIRLLEGKAGFNYDLNAYTSKLLSSNFQHNVNIDCGFTEGELFHYLGNKTSDTYARHYCNNNIDTLVYADAGKINRWAYRYDPRNTETENRRIMKLYKEDGTVTTGRYLEGVANADLTLTASEHAVGYIEIEVDCAHGVEIKICDYLKVD